MLRHEAEHPSGTISTAADGSPRFDSPEPGVATAALVLMTARADAAADLVRAEAAAQPL
jgi:hypothetical protein